MITPAVWRTLQCLRGALGGSAVAIPSLVCVAWDIETRSRVRQEQSLLWIETNPTPISVRVLTKGREGSRYSMNDVGRWLEQNGIGKYADVFAENEIEFDVLPP